MFPTKLKNKQVGEVWPIRVEWERCFFEGVIFGERVWIDYWALHRDYPKLKGIPHHFWGCEIQLEFFRQNDDYFGLVRQLLEADEHKEASSRKYKKMFRPINEMYHKMELLLPTEVITAHLKSDWSHRNDETSYSELILIWFQDHDKNPWENLEKITWEVDWKDLAGQYDM